MFAKKNNVTLQCFKKGDQSIKMFLACFQLHTYYRINGTKALPSRWTEAVKRSVRL